MAAVLGLAACANDATETASDKMLPQSGAMILSVPQGAVAGCLSVEVTDELAERIETAQAATRSGGGAMTRSGVADMDLVLERIGAERFARVFPYEARFEQRHREFGLHRWYTVSPCCYSAIGPAGAGRWRASPHASQDGQPRQESSVPGVPT